MEGPYASGTKPHPFSDLMTKNTKLFYLESLMRYALKETENQELPVLFENCSPRLNVFEDIHAKAICNIIKCHEQTLSKLYNSVFHKLQIEDEMELFVIQVEEKIFSRGGTLVNALTFAAVIVSLACRLYANGQEDLLKFAIQILNERYDHVRPKYGSFKCGRYKLHRVTSILANNPHIIPIVSPMDYFADETKS